MKSPIFNFFTFKNWGFFHLCFIMLFCLFAAYSKYCKFNNVKQLPIVQKVATALFFNNLITSYGKYTGSGSGYGFFAPNIRSNGLIIGDCAAQQVQIKFRSNESKCRFAALSSEVTDYLLQKDTSNNKQEAEEQEKYYDIILKSIGVQLFKQSSCQNNTFYISYNLLNYPTRAEFLLGQRGYSLIKLKELKLEIK